MVQIQLLSCNVENQDVMLFSCNIVMEPFDLSVDTVVHMVHVSTMVLTKALFNTGTRIQTNLIVSLMRYSSCYVLLSFMLTTLDDLIHHVH